MVSVFQWKGHKGQMHHWCVSLWRPLDGLILMGILMGSQSSLGEGRSAALSINLFSQLWCKLLELGPGPLFLIGLQLLAEFPQSVLMTLSKQQSASFHLWIGFVGNHSVSNCKWEIWGWGGNTVNSQPRKVCHNWGVLSTWQVRWEGSS